MGQRWALSETGFVLASIHSHAKITSLILFCIEWEAQSRLLHPERPAGVSYSGSAVLLPCAALLPPEPAVDPCTQQPCAFLFLFFVCTVPLSHGQSTSFTHLLLRFSFSTWLHEIWWHKKFEFYHTPRALSAEVSLKPSKIICHVFENHCRVRRLFLCLLSCCGLQTNYMGDKAQRSIYFTFCILYTNVLH